MTASELVKMDSSGKMASLMFSASKQAAIANDKVSNIRNEMMNLIMNKDDAKKAGKDTAQIDKDLAAKKLEFEYAQIAENKGSTEASGGQGLHGVVASPTLNYWNNKWST